MTSLFPGIFWERWQIAFHVDHDAEFRSGLSITVLEKKVSFLNQFQSLHEWCNWLTPPGILPKRFDTAFYLTSIPCMPSYAKQDGGETVDLVTMDPFEALEKSLKSEIILHPPQFVELSRMAKMSILEVLSDYAKKRQERGINRWCPVQYMFRKGFFKKSKIYL